jgi:hypothetical protein
MRPNTPMGGEGCNWTRVQGDKLKSMRGDNRVQKKKRKCVLLIFTVYVCLEKVRIEVSK